MRTDRGFRLGVLASLIVSGLACSGCSTMNNTEKGAAIGAAGGGAVGLGVGALTNSPRLGAAVGALGGGALGAAFGSNKDDKEQKQRDVQQAQAVAVAQAQADQQRMGIFDVIHMSKANQSEQVIINQIANTGSTFNLTPSDLDQLKLEGVSDRVIGAMQNARVARPVAPARVVVVEPQPTTIIYQQGVPVYGPPPIYAAPRPVVYGGYYYRHH